jgi:hypothetical protein
VLAAGFQRHVAKPVTPAAFLAAVAAVPSADAPVAATKH